MTKAVLVLAMLLPILSARVAADDYQLANGYIAFRGSSGLLKALCLDPTGKGRYGPVIAQLIYVGDEVPDPSDAVSHKTVGDSLILEGVRICSNPREVGSTDSETAVRLAKGKTLGQLFATDKPGMVSVSIRVATYLSKISGVTLRLYKDSPTGKLIAEKKCETVEDNSWLAVAFPAQPAGTYYIEMSNPRGPVGWWTSIQGPKVGLACENGKPLDYGARTFKAKLYDIFPATIKVTLDGPNFLAQVTPDKPDRSLEWRFVTPFARDGYETSDKRRIPFSRFYSDLGQYMPIAELKRRGSIEFGMPAKEWVQATGNGAADIRFALQGESLRWDPNPDSMTLALGKKLSFAVRPHEDDVPAFYPRFYSSDAELDASLNSFFYERAFSWPAPGVNPDWFEWLAMIHFWCFRPGEADAWRNMLLNCKIGDDGYVYTWGDKIGWPFPDNARYDTRHFTTNPCFILACMRYYAWTGDKDFLGKNASRLRAAMDFMLRDLKGAEGVIVLPSKDHGGTPDDVPSNYWDDLPFGGKSAYENAYFHAALGAMSSVETALGDTDRARELAVLREKCRKTYNELFWNDRAGRYIGCIDKNGVVRDYGFTFVNMEAAVYDLPDDEQVKRIYRWMERGKTASGKADTYSRFQFAPRVNTIDCKDWWYLNGKAEIPSQAFDTHLENGGAILYTSGCDVMARAKYLGADNAFKRFEQIIDRYRKPDRLCGGSPLFFGETNGWQVGTDIPFPESGLAPASFLYAFVGVQATVDGLMIRPNLPAKLSLAGVKNLRYRGVLLNIEVTPTSVHITGADPKQRIDVLKTLARGESFLFTLPTR